MADIAEKAQQQQEGQKNFLGMLFSTPFHFLGVMFGSLLGAIVVEWLCMYTFWPDAGWKHAQQMFQHELGWLSQDLLHSVVIKEPGRTATWLAQTVYDWLMVKTGMQDNINALTQYARLTSPQQTGTLNLRYELGRAMIKFQDYGLAALYTVLTFCVRMVILTLTIPLFALAAFTGLVDGLVRRDLRKFGSGRESSYLYHKARGTIIPLTIVPWTVYLAIPISISPLLILLPCAVLLGVSVYITVSSFKKYL
ncbi:MULTISPECIES: TIGR03747 family integrating conjugative element membrane protein [Pseudomonas]|jgi:integrating conjugative element membrane protein (TIGR03747 family)|uniref:TIGR03747 family integrating conjugative element membrane protein n=2 Tax=Pseudomonas TaxID=286 RepID=A0A7Y1QGB1_9PSED|nr:MULTISPECIES: TIGR03747 family integrating conjugative element membrane protein [Pseudomonas]MBJ2236146.1 TIGR03747 family integrating conjugative element membrane protein [Pseudomonas fluorescens]KRP78868.1 membrane protein [Pseudomonas lactis]MBH3370551.1 TIGR03747 family integrating conjugative element membrane protein [Pseudomonas carnis]MBJ2287491.1 TIGR03747 family integrating conjugative element membrane protein [Pseudomonas sp. MF6755]MBW9242761.1 TIGR03747 family integrating conjug